MLYSPFPPTFFFYTFFTLLRLSFRAPFICFTHSCFQFHGEHRSNMTELPYSITITSTNSLASVPAYSPFFLSVGRLSVFPAQAQLAAVYQFGALACIQRCLFSSYFYCLCHHISSQIGPASCCCCISFCLVLARYREIVVYQLMPFLFSILPWTYSNQAFKTLSQPKVNSFL